MFARVSLALLALVLSGPVLHGQGFPLGKRVRVTFTDSSRHIGRADSTQGGRLWLQNRQDSLDLAQATRIEVSRGRKPKWLLGAGIGTLAGLAAGAAVKSIAESNIDPEDDALITLAYLGAGAGTGLVIGTGLSFVLARERWEPVPPDLWMPARANPSLHAARGWHFGLRFSH